MKNYLFLICATRICCDAHAALTKCFMAGGYFVMHSHGPGIQYRHRSRLGHQMHRHRRHHCTNKRDIHMRHVYWGFCHGIIRPTRMGQ